MRRLKCLVTGVMLSCLGNASLAVEQRDQQTAKPVHFTLTQFKEAQRSNLRFIVAFHKKDCSRCAQQQKILQKLSLSPELLAIRMFIVDFDDTERLKQFDVSFHDTLILYRGQREINRSHGLLEVGSIKRQIVG